MTLGEYACITIERIRARSDASSRDRSDIGSPLGQTRNERISAEEKLAQARRVWLVVALEHSIDYQLETVDWFQGQRPLLQEVDLGGIRVYLLGKQAPQHPTPLSSGWRPRPLVQKGCLPGSATVSESN
jgi:hypothetical protein